MNDEHSWWLTLMFLIVVAAFLRHAMYRRIREVDFSLWQSLGEPGLFEGKLKYRAAEAIYLFRLKYLRAGDRKLTWLCAIYSLLCICMWALFLSLVAVQFWR